MILPALIATSLALTPTVPLGAHETFGGTVNGARTGVTIRMACFGPDRPVVSRHLGRTSKAALVRTGHPMAGQTLGVFVPEAMTDPSFGRTGDPARAIVVSIATGSGHPVRVARIRHLQLTRPVISATRPLPIWPMLPCSCPRRLATSSWHLTICSGLNPSSACWSSRWCCSITCRHAVS